MNRSNHDHEIDPRIVDRIDQLAHTPHLLVASDYDGTLAPIVTNPAEAHPLRESMVALRTLAGLASTHVAIVSGRSLDDLAELTDLPESVHLVGSHGSEFEPGFARSLTKEQESLRRELHRLLAEIAGAEPGFSLETKPASIAFHFRNAEPEAAERAVRQINEGPATIPGVHVKRGKMVIELAVVGTHKGEALDTIRQRVGANAVIFFGDDVTDEDVFKRLRGPDLGVKIGEGETAAPYRVADPHDAARLLARLAERRGAWVCGSEAVPIESHSMLSDLRTVALVTPEARVTWMCAPRIDSPSIFAELLGGPSAGYFAIRAADGSEPIRQQYIDDSLVLTTEYASFRITDYLDCSSGRPDQRAGRTDLVRVVGGSGRVVIEFAPRLDFSRTPTLLEAHHDGLYVLDSPDPIVLRAPGVAWRIKKDGAHHTAVAEVELGDEPLTLSLRCGSGTLRASSVHAVDRGHRTVEFWEEWTHKLELPGVATEAVKRSAMLIRGLVYGPTGAISAAATTSLPETIGGVRNWDYRYCWPRDAALGALALVHLGSHAEAMQLLDWLLGVVERSVSPDRISPLYTVSGDELATEGEISELSGYAGSRPVRIGNAASRQVQLDVFGPVVELMHQLAVRDAPLTPQHWRIVEAMVQAVSSRWQEPDHGIWEIRAQRRNHVHSKVMCWLTVDRAIKAAHLLRDREPRDWAALRDRIAEDVLTRGWKDDPGAFTASYEQTDIDAASLHVGLSGLIARDDQRFLATVEAVERELLEEGCVYRYRYEDGLPGFEGAFNLCTCWLIQSYIMLGRHDEAQAMFDRYLGLAGPTGLLSEEYAVNAQRGLGNVPQVYSHAGLIECAVLLDTATNGGG